MAQCEYCQAVLPDDARFCGSCGWVVGGPVDGQTRINNSQRINLPAGNQNIANQALVRVSFPGIDQPTTPLPSVTASHGNQYNSINAVPDSTALTTPLNPEEEEERRRRAALLGIGLLGIDALPQQSSTPMVQGTPPFNGIASVRGVPQTPGSGFAGSAQGMGGSLQIAPQGGSVASPVTPVIPTSSPGHTLHPPNGQSGSGSSSSSGTSTGTGSQGTAHHGCAPMLLITAIIVPLVILGSIIGLGLTIFAPSLTLSGSSIVSPGQVLALHGSHFVPGSSISLTLDASTQLFVTRPQSSQATLASSRAAGEAFSMQGMAAGILLPVAGQNTVNARGDGTFDVSITIDPAWSIGKHTIVASEAITHRNTSLSFTIAPAEPLPSPTGTGTVTPTPTTTVTPTPTKKVTPTLTPTVTSTAPSLQPGLSCISPASLTLGPVLALTSQSAPATVTLCAQGSGVVPWTASWNASQSTWLSLSATSGQISAPGQVQISVSANTAQLAAGTYSATVTFSSSASNVTQTLAISLTVQSGCINVTPTTLAFTGVVGVSDPAAQTVAISNCGLTGSWSAATQTTDGASWLFASPASGTLNAGTAPTNVTVTATNLKTALAAGTYTGSVTFTLGTVTSVVQVTLTVLPPPTLSASPLSLVGSSNCTFINNYVCVVTLTNNSTGASLAWTSKANLIPSAVISLPSDTIPAGKTETVTITISANDCAAGASIVFTGPANSVTVTWQCSPLIG